MPDFKTTISKLEELPSDGGRTVDTLPRGLLRIFVRMNEPEEACKRLGRRLAALEGTTEATPAKPHAGYRPGPMKNG